MTITVAAKNADLPATDAQAALIAKLLNVPAAQVKGYVETVKANRTRKEASDRIAELIAAEKAASAVAEVAKHIPALAPAAPVAEFGPKFVSRGEWHVIGESFYLIAKSQETGYLYAKRRCPGGGFDSAKGMIFKLGASTKVTAEHANLVKAYGDQWDACMFCSKPLDLPESRLAGCGQTCAGKFGIPWGSH